MPQRFMIYIISQSNRYPIIDNKHVLTIDK